MSFLKSKHPHGFPSWSEQKLKFKPCSQSLVCVDSFLLLRHWVKTHYSPFCLLFLATLASPLPFLDENMHHCLTAFALALPLLWNAFPYIFLTWLTFSLTSGLSNVSVLERPALITPHKKAIFSLLPFTKPLSHFLFHLNTYCHLLYTLSFILNLFIFVNTRTQLQVGWELISFSQFYPIILYMKLNVFLFFKYIVWWFLTHKYTIIRYRTFWHPQKVLSDPLLIPGNKLIWFLKL